MPAMLPTTTALHEASSAPVDRLGHFVLPAIATLVLHGAIIFLLLGNWSPSAPAVANDKVLKTQLVTISVAPAPTPLPAPSPVIEAPPPVPPPAPVVEQPPEPVKPQVDQAAIARQRARELEQREEARVEEQRRITEQQRQEQLQREIALAAEERAYAAAELERQRLADISAEQARIRQYQPVSKTPPAYPQRALDLGTEGDCTVEYTVSAQGRVIDPVVVEGSCDDPIFVRPSLNSARSFRYAPRMVDGVAVAVPGVRNTFRFRLEQ